MIYLAYALAYAAGVAGVVALADSHPGFAACVLLMTASLSMKTTASKGGA